MISNLEFQRLSPYIGVTSLPVSCSLQALSNLYYLFGGFMDYLWSRKLNISNFGPANRKILPMDGNFKMHLSIPRRFLTLIVLYFDRLSLGARGFVMSLRHPSTTFAFQDGNESHNHNLQAILTNSIVSCSTLSDQGYAEDFYDR
ncbi:hypothetical protein Tco_0212111 [Tanacetum coccineum]